MDTNLSVHFIERLQELPSYLGEPKKNFFQALGLPENRPLETLSLEKAYQVLLNYPRINPQWLFFGYGNKMLTGPAAEKGGVNLLQQIELLDLMLELSQQRIRELENKLKRLEVKEVRAQAGKEALMEVVNIIYPNEQRLNPTAFKALMDTLDSIDKGL